MKEKRIAFITHVGAPGGAEYVMKDLAVALKKNAEVVSFQSGSLNKIIQSEGLDYKLFAMPEMLLQFKREDGLLKVIKSLPSAIAIVPKYAFFCRQYGLLVCMSQKSFLLSAVTKPFHRKPIIWFMNDIVSKDHFSKASLLIIKILSKLFASKVVLNSHASLQAWEKSGCQKSKACVIYPGIDVEKIEQQLLDQRTIQNYKQAYCKNGKHLVGIFGRLSPWKGQDVFLKAISKINGVSGIIVGEAQFGEQSYKATLKNSVEQLSLNNKVHFLGHVDDVAKAMAACDVVVHASTSPEPYGIVIGEAMAAGTPVIATNAGGAKELVIPRETGLLTTPGDDSELAEAIKYYINNPDLSKKTAAKAKAHVVKGFSLNAMITSFKNLIEVELDL